MIYCDNDPCEAEALMHYVTQGGTPFHLCFTCSEAFQLGQVNHEAELEYTEQTKTPAP